MCLSKKYFDKVSKCANFYLMPDIECPLNLNILVYFMNLNKFKVILIYR
jgi:hypothetical protein